MQSILNKTSLLILSCRCPGLFNDLQWFLKAISVSPVHGVNLFVLCREFDDQLEDVTRSIRDGWARTCSPWDTSNEPHDASNSPPCGSPHDSVSSPTAPDDITGTVALMERLIEDIHSEQEETRRLLAQDVGTTRFVYSLFCENMQM